MRGCLLDLELGLTHPVGKAGPTTGRLWERTGRSEKQGNPGLPGTHWSVLIQDLRSGFGLQLPRPFADNVPCLSSISEHTLLPLCLVFLFHLPWRSTLSAFFILPPSWDLTPGQAGLTNPACPRGLLTCPCLPHLLLFPNHRQLGLGAFPVESRWQGIYRPFQDFVRSGCPGELQEALLGFHVQSSRELRESQEYLCCDR